MSQNKNWIMWIVDHIAHNHEKKIKNKKNIKEMRELFDELDVDAKNSLLNMIDFLLNDQGVDSEIHDDNSEMNKKLQKIREIIMLLPEKSYMHVCGLLQEKLKKQQELAETLSSQYAECDEKPLEKNERACKIRKEEYIQQK